MKPQPVGLSLGSIKVAKECIIGEPVDDRVVAACKILLNDIHKNARDIRILEAKLDRVDKLATGLLNFAHDVFSTKKSEE